MQGYKTIGGLMSKLVCGVCGEPNRAHILLSVPISPYDWHAIFTQITPAVLKEVRIPQQRKASPALKTHKRV